MSRFLSDYGAEFASAAARSNVVSSCLPRELMAMTAIRALAAAPTMQTPIATVRPLLNNDLLAFVPFRR